MTGMYAKAPTLVWLLTALTCFVSGMTVTEGRYQSVSLPRLEPVGVVVTVEVAYAPTPTPAPTALPTPTPTPMEPPSRSRTGSVVNVR